MGFSFVHAADLHLDSPFRGITKESACVADALRSATFDAYDALIHLCIDRGVQFLLVAGDVYDGADRSLRAQLRFHDGLTELHKHGIRSFIVHGNHDPLDGWSASIDWPAGAHIFGGSEVETVEVEVDGRPVAAVSGISYPSQKETRNLAEKFRPQHPDLFQIALLHCNCGGNTAHEPYAPCGLDDLVGADFDYWALGHVHTQAILNVSPHVVYPGNSQGRSVRELGERGCYVITVDEGRQVDMEFCPLDAVRWFSTELRIEDIHSVDGLEQVLYACVAQLREKAQGRPAVCRIALVGRSPLYGALNRDDSVSELLQRTREDGLAEEPFVWVETIEPRCGPVIDLAQRRNTKDLLGQLLAISEELYGAADLEEHMASALADLHRHTRAKKALDDLSPKELEELLHNAEYLCANLLEADQ